MLAKNLNVLTNPDETTEISIRLNSPEVIQGEPVNIVTNVNNAIIGVKKDQQETKRKSLSKCKISHKFCNLWLVIGTMKNRGIYAIIGKIILYHKNGYFC